MPEEYKGTTPPQEGDEKRSNLNQVFQILNTDNMAGHLMMCQRNGDTLNFYTLFASEQAAGDAHNQLVQMGKKSRLEGRKVFLTAQFPGDEIDELAKTYNSIPERKK